MKTPMTVLIVSIALVLVSCGGGGNVLELAVGDCFDDPEVVDGQVRDVSIIDCDEPHDNEVFALIQLPEGEFPGQEAVSSQADAGCTEQFASYVGADYAVSEYFASVFSPSPESWEQGDRTIVCYLFLPDARLQESARGTNR